VVRADNDPVTAAPADEYAARLAARRTTHGGLVGQDERLSYLRLLVFAIGALIASLAWRDIVHPAWLAPALIGFVVLVNRHDSVIRARDAAARGVAFYERGLARIEDRWIGTGESGDRFRDDEHLYANDLDLFGKGSLFELLSIARTRAGEETLATWLKEPAAPDVIRTRQQAIAELSPRLDLRERLAVAGSDVRAGVHTEALVSWAAAPSLLGGSGPRMVATVLTIAAAAGVTWWIVSGDAMVFLLVIALEVFFAVSQRRRVQHVLHGSEQPAHDLDILAHLLTHLERERFEASRLAELRTNLDTDGVAASRAIAQLHRLSEMHAWQHNQFFGPVAAAFLWGTHLAFAIESWRRRHGAHVAKWLSTVGEFEAFSSLAAFRYEHPADVFAAIEEAPEHAATFEGEALGHPLIPAARMVRNDVHLGGAVQLAIVSGSNMSGKSTLLRTVGINAVLALMGAPARASRLRLTPLAIGATLRIQDSLQEGRSRFFAEITRVRRLADLANGSSPLLFLLDELFHGTNSHDRLLGAVGVLRTLLDRGAIGLITTHDLALTQIAAGVGPRATNVHFDDTFEGGEIRFDYRMKPGPVTRSNALALMRAVGLDVDEGPAEAGPHDRI
jgi:MutS domain V